MNPQLNYKDYILLFIAVITFFASLICALRIPSNAPDIMASIGLGIVSILFFVVFVFSNNKDEDSLLDSTSKLTEEKFDSFIEFYKSMLDQIFEEIAVMDFSTTPLDDIRSYRDFLKMYATTQLKKIPLDTHGKIQSLYTQLDEIVNNHTEAPLPEPCPITGLLQVIRQKPKGESIRQSLTKQQYDELVNYPVDKGDINPEPCPITALQEEIKQKLEEQAVIPGSITRVEYDNLLDTPTSQQPFPEAILSQLAGFAQTENKVTFGVDANESGFAQVDPTPPLPYKAIPSVPDEEEMQRLKEQAATVASNIISDTILQEKFPLTLPVKAEEELMQSLREEAIATAFDIDKDVIKASPKRTKSGRFAKKSK